MLNSELVRFFRWGLPGWVAILSFAAFVGADLFNSPATDRGMLAEFGKIIAAAQGVASPLGAILVAAAGFPLGFMIYQFYFFMRWTSPFSRDGFLPPLIEPRWLDLQRALREIPDTALALGQPWRIEWIQHPAFGEDHGFKWRYMEAFFAETLWDKENGPTPAALYHRHHYLMEVMHFLGASIAAIYLTFFAYLLFKSQAETFLISLHLLVLTMFLLPLMIAMNQEHVRKISQELYTREPGSKHEQAAHYSFAILAVVLVFLLLADPNMHLSAANPMGLVQFVLRLLVIALVAAAWWHTVKSDRTVLAVAALTAGLLVLATRYLDARLPDTVMFFGSLFPIRLFHWSFTLPMLIFLVVQMVLVRNRQNADDDIVCLEYYMIKRYLSQRCPPPPGDGNSDSPDRNQKDTSRQTMVQGTSAT